MAADIRPNQWAAIASEYLRLVTDSTSDSRYLRQTGLIPQVLELADVRPGSLVLDAGGGNGWLARALGSTATVHTCDSAPVENVSGTLRSIQDVRCLAFADSVFDSVVCSLVLMFVDDVGAALSEFRRVTRPGGTLVVALTHPYFYRMFRRVEDELVLTGDLSSPSTISLRIGGKVGPVSYRYRRYDEYVNAMLEAGWLIDRVRDWFIDEQDYAAAGHGSDIPRSGRIPLYAFLRAVKPESAACADRK